MISPTQPAPLTRPLNIWLVTVGEPLPTDVGHARLLRAGMLARLMRLRGHEVHWWTSAFDHQKKRVRSSSYQALRSEDGTTIHLLPGRPYGNNVSLLRMRNHREVAAAFSAAAARASVQADVILASYPTIELCAACVKHGQSAGVPVALDVRDLWPDAIEEMAPPPLRPLARLALLPMARQARNVLRNADAIVGITQEFVDWGLRNAGRQAGEFDRPFPLAYFKDPFDPAQLEAAQARWVRLGVRPGERLVVFFGTVGRQVELATAISAARLMKADGVRFVLCGDGDGFDALHTLASGSDNVLLPGWVDAECIHALMRIASVGIAPYRPLGSFTSSIPNKVAEYLAGGLPIVSTLAGVTGKLLSEHECGVHVPFEDAHALVDALRALLTDEKRRAAMAANALTLFRARFDATRVYGDLIDHLAGLAVRHGRE